MASFMAVMVIFVPLAALIYFVRTLATKGQLSPESFSTDRRLASSFTLAAWTMLMVGVTGMFEVLDTATVAEPASWVVALGTTLWWANLRWGTTSKPTEPTWSGYTRVGSVIRPDGPSQTEAPPVPASPGTPEPGWYDDPWDPARTRRWNGLEWTPDTRPHD